MDEAEKQVDMAEEPVASPTNEELAFEKAQAEIGKLKDELLRALAEIENTRRRGERQAQEARAYAIDKFARELLPVADNLGRALEALPEDVRAEAGETVNTFIEGVALTEKSLLEAFGRHGLRRIGAKGEPFDANLHQAVASVPSDAPAGAIAEVFQLGYALGDRTLRPAMVAVSAGVAATAPVEPQAPQDSKIDIKV
ncbi:MAG: nucleotide exchange factor GrpE [Alphaproteobacteria bacterium]